MSANRVDNYLYYNNNYIILCVSACTQMIADMSNTTKWFHKTNKDDTDEVCIYIYIYDLWCTASPNAGWGYI
jgi:hypothetical protein